MISLKIYFTSIKGRRKSNEDRHNIILNLNEDNPNYNPINLFGIYDGHGGTWVSEYLEKNIPQYYMNTKFRLPFNKEFHTKVFQLIQSELLKKPTGYSNGSTCLLNLMFKYNGSIYMNVVNLGDSRMCVVDTNGITKSITTDHKPDDPYEKSRLTKMGGEIYKDSEGVFRIGDLSLSRAFGDGDNAPYISQKPDVFTIMVTSQTKYIVMACDGLWDIIETKNLGKIINNIKKNNPKIDNISVELANYALKKGSTDNISVIVIEVVY